MVTVVDAKGTAYQVDADAARKVLQSVVPRDRLSVLFPAFPKGAPSVLLPKEINLLAAAKLIRKPSAAREMSLSQMESKYERLLSQAAREAQQGARGMDAGDDLGVWMDLAEGSYLTRKREFDELTSRLGIRSKDVIRAIAERAGG
jgi:hypothetical protein